MSRLLATIILSLATLCALAIPAKRTVRLYTQPDGSQISIILTGDEHCHYYTDTEGNMLTLTPDGYYRKASAEEANAVIARGKARRASANARRASKRNRAFGEPTVITGKKRGLIILVDFPDKPFARIDANDMYNRMFNQVGYSDSGSEGSLHDYFYDQSYGQFDVTFDVVGPVTVSKSYKYYGENNKDGDDKYPGVMVIEACRLADPYVNFADYDWTGNGKVDQVFVLYAGYGENDGGGTYTIWPHEFTLTDEKKEYNDGEGAIVLDGVTIDTYACSNELTRGTGSDPVGIGTAAHEFCHCLGLPDLYATEGNGYGMDYWSVMAAGSYSGPKNRSEVPSGFTAYERWFIGWLQPTELCAPCTVTDMPCLGDEPVAYIIYNDGNLNEYYLLENRQDTKWFKYVYTTTGNHGMLVTHVDYDKTAWRDNAVNANTTHQRMTIIPANKRYPTSTGDRCAQLFPGLDEVTELTNTSHYNYGGKLFNANIDGTQYMNKPITNIAESTAGLISFDFMGRGDAPDGIRDIEAVDQQPATAASYYTLGGAPVSKPTAPGIYLKHKNGMTRKVAIPSL